MLTSFDSLFDLMTAFPDELACIDHLKAIRWARGEFCPHCGCDRLYAFGDRKTWKCAECRQRFSIKVGTIFEDSKLPLRKWFMAIWLITNHPKGIASTTLAKDLKITQKSAWFVLHRLRHAHFTRRNATVSRNCDPAGSRSTVAFCRCCGAYRPMRDRLTERHPRWFSSRNTDVSAMGELN